jgi:hypothetical protein
MNSTQVSLVQKENKSLIKDIGNLTELYLNPEKGLNLTQELKVNECLAELRNVLVKTL